MFDVGAVVEFRQHAEQTQAADRSPADKFDEAIGWIGVGRYQHAAAGEFAVVEGEKQAAAGGPFFFVVGAQDEGAALHFRFPDEKNQKKAPMAEGVEKTNGGNAGHGGGVKACKGERSDISRRA